MANETSDVNNPKPSVEAYENVTEMDKGNNLQNFNFEEETEAERKLIRKVDMYILPTIWVVYFLSYMVSFPDFKAISSLKACKLTVFQGQVKHR